MATGTVKWYNSTKGYGFILNEEGGADIAELEKAIADARMPDEVEKAARKELKRLERMPEAAGEY